MKYSIGDILVYIGEDDIKFKKGHKFTIHYIDLDESIYNLRINFKEGLTCDHDFIISNFRSISDIRNDKIDELLKNQ
jgi:hypothetical protein